MQFQQLASDQIKIPGETYWGQIVPYFMHLNLLDELKSEEEGRAVYKMHEVVQLRFPGDRYYSPVVPTDSMYRKVGNQVITYAERWADQYRQFLANEAQVAEGTPLDNLVPYGITPAQLSLCRALKIYTIEALHHLEGANKKSLGHHSNELKPMAARYMADRSNGKEQSDEIAKLKAEIEALKAVIPATIPPEPEVQAVIQQADDEFYASKTEDELREILKSKTGKYPVGRPAHATLVQLVKDLA
jgi:hypothetical protein